MYVSWLLVAMPGCYARDQQADLMTFHAVALPCEISACAFVHTIYAQVVMYMCHEQAAIYLHGGETQPGELEAGTAVQLD